MSAARRNPTRFDLVERIESLIAEYNAGSRMQGQLDTDLSDLGREQAVAAAEVLAKRQPLMIVSSDLRRALDTAVALGDRSGQPVNIDTRLRETHLGDWQGLTHLEVDAALAHLVQGDQVNPVIIRKRDERRQPA